MVSILSKHPSPPPSPFLRPKPTLARLRRRGHIVLSKIHRPEFSGPSPKLLDDVFEAYQNGQVVKINGLRALMQQLGLNKSVQAEAARGFQWNLFTRLAQRLGVTRLEPNLNYGNFKSTLLFPVDPHQHNRIGGNPNNPTLFTLSSFLYEPCSGITGNNTLFLHNTTGLSGSVSPLHDPKHPIANAGTLTFSPQAMAILRRPERSTRIPLASDEFNLIVFNNKTHAHSTGAFRVTPNKMPERVLHTLWLDETAPKEAL